jgi:MoaA/NifB/PqqE/SkfB family radical SAM enzyme
MHFQLKNKSLYPIDELRLQNYGCYSLSKYFEIHENGDVSLCCYSWLPKFFGNVLTDSPKQILQNIDRFKVVYDMDNGSFTECTDHCPYLNSFLSGTYDKSNSYIVPLTQLRQEKKHRPIVVNFSYDRSCNLQCPSCRPNLILFKTGQNKKLDTLHNSAIEFVDYLIEQGNEVIIKITGSGDAFASPTYWQYLKSLTTDAKETLKLRLHTNGLLMTKDRMLELQPIWNNIQQLNISIDAANSDTYSLVRKNGSFEKLKQNLNDLDDLLSSSKYSFHWLTNFTVQKSNYKEIVDFLIWQLNYSNIKNVYFSLVEKWGHISDDDYINQYMLNEDEMKELHQLLQNPVFEDKKVILGNLNMVRN